MFITLSRTDVFNRIDNMCDDPSRFPVLPDVKEKTKAKLPDYLQCEERCFGLMFERNDIAFRFILRMSKETVKRCEKIRPVQHMAFFPGGNWYSMIVDQSYESKREIYRILDECYDFTVKLFFDENGAYDTEKAKAEQAIIEKAAAADAELIDKSLAEAEKAYRAALEKFKAANYTNFVITRREIAEDMQKSKDPDVTVVVRFEKPLLPVSIKLRGKTYAMLHGTDMGVFMLIRLEDSYAEKLSDTHPEISRSSFPKGPNWYYIPIDGAFKDKESLYRVLSASRAFTEKQVFGII